MRLLAISDIHGNAAAVRQLRFRESNAFDAVVIAGDIGGDSASEILGILESFGCPVLYVYGNWDAKLEYDHSFGPACEHIHLRPIECGPYSFVGFSGLPTHWGRNPIAEVVRRKISERHRAVLKRHTECEAAIKGAEFEIESTHQARVAELSSRTKDCRKLGYRAKLEEIEDKRDRLIAKARLPLRQIEESQEYASYHEELRQSYADINRLNRRALVEIIKASNAGPTRTIVVTHERLYRTSEDMYGVPLFLFGHRHGSQKTTFQGPRYVNVSALDLTATVRPVNRRRFSFENCRNINIGNHVIIETGLRDFDVRYMGFEPNIDGWKFVNFVLHGAPWLEQAH